MIDTIEATQIIAAGNTNLSLILTAFVAVLIWTVYKGGLRRSFNYYDK